MRRRDYFFQRAFAAILAMSWRCSAVRLCALAFPPFRPPARRNGFLTTAGSTSGEPSRRSPMACSTTRRAITVKSWDVPSRFGAALLERLGMPHSGTNRPCRQGQRFFKLTHYRLGHVRSVPVRLSPIAGDVDIVAHVQSIANADGWCKVGIMIRESLAPLRVDSGETLLALLKQHDE